MSHTYFQKPIILISVHSKNLIFYFSKQFHEPKQNTSLFFKLNSLLKITLFFVVFLSALIPIEKPKECSVSASVFNNFSYEKSLCYMKWDMSYFRAEIACKQRGMRLFNHNSSPNATISLKQFANNVLKGQSKAEVFIAGILPGKRCLTLQGDSTLSYVFCHLAFNFICEFIQKCKWHL